MTHFLAPLIARDRTGSALVNARTGSVIASVVEAATDSRSRRRGLLGRDGLKAGHGIVLAPCSAVHTWFMRFPIDVIFVARDGRVLKTVERLQAWRLAARPGAFAVIELSAGALRNAGLACGDHMVFRPCPSEETSAS